MQSLENGIGLRIKAARDSYGISQTDLHKLTGLSRTVLINYEAGRHSPGARELKLLCDALKVSPNQIIYGTEEPHVQATGLADTLMNMGEAAIMPVMVVAPIIVEMLGKDDLRTLLTLIESMLKAKSYEDYRMVMEIVRVFKEITPSERIELAERLKSDPEAAQEFQQVLQKRLIAATKIST